MSFPGRRLREAKEPWVVLAPLVLAQWVAVAIFSQTIERNGWLFYQGGDQTWFYTSGWIVGNGHIPETFVGWVWPLVMLPITALAGPNYLAGVSAVVLLQFVLLLPLGVLCVYAIASRIGGRLLGYWAAAWWIVAPYAVIPLFVDRYHSTYVDQALPQGLGLTGLGDFPSMIAVLASAYFAVRALETGAISDAVVAGLLAGLAIGIKPANGLFAVAPLAALALARRWRRGLDFALAVVPGVVVLALWKHKGSGIALLAAEPIRLAAAEVPDFSPPTFWERLRGYAPLDRDQLNHQFLGFREFFWSARLLEYLPIAGLLAVARRSVPIAGFLAVWLAAFFLVKGSSPAVNVETGSIWRLLMPAWPAYFLLGASLPLLVPQWGTRLADRFGSSVRPLPAGGGRAVALAGAAVFVLPAGAFLALSPDDTGEATKIPLRSLFLPIDESFRPQGAQSEAGVLRVTWPPATGYAEPFYVVLRSPRRYIFPATTDVVVQGQRCRSPGGAIRCALEMEEIGRTRARLWREAPPRGAWTYRIGIAANWLDHPDFGDIFVVSAPLDVVVR